MYMSSCAPFTLIVSTSLLAQGAKAHAKHRLMLSETRRNWT